MRFVNVVRHTNKILTVGIVGLAFVMVLAISALVTPKAQAAPVQGFEPGNIIDEPTFLNTSSMTAIQIQNFLSSKVPVCDTQGTQVSEFGGGTRAQWAASRGYSPPFTCLKDYTEGGRGAAQIIYDVAQAYQVNPQVLIVLLQKEQALVTDTWPLATQYRTATGYGCPDTAACDSQYFGLTNQITWAARMFHAIITASPTWYTPYVLGNNFIQWSPNSSCGGTTVNIQNRSTQALYNYTPYQPNQAALNAGYGTGDACSAYGNRNFYVYFKDWFGPTRINGTFLRTVDNGTLYLVEGTTKYPIADINILGALYPLGGVGYVSQTYLDSLTMGQTMGRVIKASNGTIYFYDSGIKLSFGSCAQVADYGSSCAQAIPLSDSLINLLSNGPGMTSLIQTTSGKTFNIVGGVRKEVFDHASLQAAGNNDGVNVLNESSIYNLPYGTPVVRSNVVVASRSSNQKHLYSNNTYYKLPTTLANYSYIQSLPNGVLDDSSIPSGQINNNFNGFITEATPTSVYMLMPQGKVQLTNPAAWGVSTSAVDSTFVASLPNASDPINNGLVMTPGNGTVYFVTGGKKRPVPGWTALVDLKVQPFTINTISATAINAIPTGAFVYPPGHMVKTADSDTVYIIKSYTELLPISSFLFPRELGTPTSLEVMSSADFSTYTVGGVVQTQISCSGQNYVGTNGILYPMSASDLNKFGLIQANFVDAGLLCGALPKSSQAVPDFLLDSTGTIYLVQSGTKRAFTGYGAYLANGGTSQNTARVSNYFTSLIPNGATISN